MSRSNQKPGSLDQRIREEIIEKINSGTWPPGHKIPTERELIEQYGCARMTVSKAISSLVLAGLIQRNKKAGSFVRRPQMETAAFEIPDLARLILDRGHEYAFDLKKRDVRKAGDSAIGFAVPEGIDADVLRILGTHLASDIPFAVEHRIINLAVAPEAR